MSEITVSELKRRRDAGEPLVLLDVREPDEIETAALDGATYIPMREIPSRLEELPRDTPIAVMCHGGTRSGRVVDFLAANGYDNALNVEGGIDAWSTQIDPKIPRY
jgi:rhodanese-related sulfurtransferase